MTTKVYVPLWKLRRLAPRAVRVIARHKDKAPQLGRFEASLVAAANKFAELYDASRNGQVSAPERATGPSAVAALRSLMGSWFGALSRDIPGFESTTYTERSNVADDVVAGGQRLLELCKSFRDAEGAPLPYQDAMVQALDAAIALATAEVTEASARRAAEQALRDETRAAAIAFQQELIPFRRTLRAVLGATHVDCQNLRAHHGPQGDEIEEVLDETPANDADPTTPATEAPLLKAS